MEWQENTSRLHIIISNVSPMPLEFSFPRPSWVRLNHLSTNVGLFHSETHKCVMASTAACKCGAKTAEHVITFRAFIYHHLNGAHAFSDVDKNL